MKCVVRDSSHGPRRTTRVEIPQGIFRYYKIEDGTFYCTLIEIQRKNEIIEIHKPILIESGRYDDSRWCIDETTSNEYNLGYDDVLKLQILQIIK